jgi:sigma-B regulation protein RsbU (phosphoserine phosphatase)
MCHKLGEAAEMILLGSSSIPVPIPPAGLAQAGIPEPPEWAARELDGSPAAAAEQPFGRVARLAAIVLGTSLVSVTVTGRRPGTEVGPRTYGIPDGTHPRNVLEQSLLRSVTDSGGRVVIEDVRLDPRTSAGGPFESGGVRAWAGFPVRDPDGNVVGALCVADHVPRSWSARELEFLDVLAHVAAGEVALRVALRHGAERAELARTLQESLLPPRLPEIPGLLVAARYVAGGTGAEVLGDFYDVFPSVRTSWGLVVGDVCGKGVPAAKSTALARYTLRAEAHRHGRPSLILAALNQALLDWLTDDPRFLSAIYATVRPTAAGASVQVSSGGHPLALVRRADGRVQTLGRPGTLLGLLPDPELQDARTSLRSGDSLILFTDGVTEARRPADRDLYGDDRLRDLVAGLGDMPATRMADAVQQAVLEFSGGEISDDTVVMIMQVP